MSGIVGIYNLNGQPVDPLSIGRMTNVLDHRGPDGVNHWREGSVGLGHLMLHTTPESLHETLPLTDRSGHFTITADARIDNRRELIGQLGVNGKPTKEIGDSELILAAYKKWGEDCPDKLLGAFAFAIWDSRKRQLFCARDHYGVKPFYYYHQPGRFFAFASEIKALFSLDDVPQSFNERRIARRLLIPVEVSTADTFYEDVCALKGGHIGIVKPDSFSEHCYWALDPEREVRLGSDEEYAEALRDLFFKAVRCRMRSTSPLAAALSGGLDSSSVVCAAAELSGSKGRPLHTLSAIFNEVPVSDEQPFIREVLKKYDNLRPLFFEADQVSPYGNSRERSWHTDAPLGFNSYVPWHVYHMAHEQGARVMLSGFDGDTALSHGHTYLHELAREGRWLSLMLEVRGGRKRQGMSWLLAMRSWMREYALKPRLESSPLLRLLRQVWRALQDHDEEPVELGDSRADWEIGINPSFITRIEDHVIPLEEHRTERAHHHHLLTRALMARMIGAFDTTAAAAGVEVRFPFFDKRLIEFCLALPPEQKIQKGLTRMIMRRAMEGILPEKVQWRPNKSNLGPSFDRGLLKFEKGRIEELFQQDTGGVGKYVDLDLLHDVYREYAPEHKRIPKVHLLKCAFSLALWLESQTLYQQKAHGGDACLAD